MEILNLPRSFSVCILVDEEMNRKWKLWGELKVQPSFSCQVVDDVFSDAPQAASYASSSFYREQLLLLGFDKKKNK